MAPKRSDKFRQFFSPVNVDGKMYMQCNLKRRKITHDANEKKKKKLENNDDNADDYAAILVNCDWETEVRIITLKNRKILK